LTQLRTGHAPLNAHLHRIGAWETPFCAITDWETVFHFLMACDAYRNQRNSLQNSIPQTMYTIGNLLSNKECIPKMLQYVDNTGRM
ncbi:hypothetical protein M422DRAFT_99826, partial [Sphaerobolus stellatus SS14]